MLACLAIIGCGGSVPIDYEREEDASGGSGAALDTGGTTTGGGESGGVENTGGSSTGGMTTGGNPTGGELPCQTGSETCPCYGNDTCDAGLTCFSGLCVDAGTGGAGVETGGIPTGGIVGTGGVQTGGVSTGGQMPICIPGSTNSCACNGDWSNPGITECSSEGLEWMDCVCPEGTGGVGTGGASTGGSETGGQPSCDWDGAELLQPTGHRSLDGDGCYVLGDEENACVFSLETPADFIGRYETVNGMGGAIVGPTTFDGSQTAVCPVLLDLQTPDAIVAVGWSYE